MCELSAHFQLQSLEYIFLIYESVLFQNNIQCALSDVTLTGMIPGYLQIIITDIIRLTSIIKKG